MEEDIDNDIKILKEVVNYRRIDGIYTTNEVIFKALKNLIEEYEYLIETYSNNRQKTIELEYENETLRERNEHLSDLMNALETYYDITEEDLEKSVKEDR